MYRNVTCDLTRFYAPNSTENPASLAPVTFVLTQTISAGGGLIPRGEYTFTTDAAGLLDAWLAVPDDVATGAPYTCYLPSNEVFSFVLAGGTAIDLIALMVIATVPLASLAEALLATYTPLATYTAGVALLQPISTLPESIDDRVAALLTAGANITLTYNDALGTLTIAASGGGGGTTVVYGAWVNFTLENGWSNYNTIPSGYRRITIGGVDTYVELRGEIFRSPFASGLTIATLPSGFRPPTNWRQLFKIFSGTGDGQIIISPDGTIQSYTGGAAMDFSNVRIYLV